MRLILISQIILIFILGCNSNTDRSQPIVNVDTVSYAPQKTTLHWEDDFSPEEQEKMKKKRVKYDFFCFWRSGLK